MKQTFSIVPARLEDAEQIAILICLSIRELCLPDHENDPEKLKHWQANKTPEHVSNWINDSNAWCVVAQYEAGLPIGFAMMSKAGELLLCYVLPEWTGQGAGTALLQACEQYARQQGLVKIVLESTATALVFYQNQGFQLTGGCSQRGPNRCLKMEKLLTS